MRWAAQEIENDDAGRLPGLGDTIVRRFDAPEALDIRFHEVRTKSALNRVAAAARLPFGWTVNPYRGCSHACSYCLAGDTPVLLASGRTAPIAELRAGDEVYGTARRGGYRKYARTKVLAHWPTVKPAYRVILEDGTELVASGDHRFLTARGWRYVRGSGQGGRPRPHLTLADELLGLGRIAAPPEERRDYRQGHLCGLVPGDGHLGAYAYPGDGRASGVHRFRLALGNGEALARAHFGQSLRIADREDAILDRVSACLAALGFGIALEDRGRPNRVRAIRLLGGPPEELRCFDTVDPAIASKRCLQGRPVKSAAGRRVVAIERLSVELPMYDITTGTGDFIANGVISHNCFARPTHEYLDLDAGRDFEREIVVKVNVPEVLRAELGRPSWKGERVALGTNTDPYQWVEGRYRLMRGIWEAMRDFANPCSILTKSPLLLRDADLLREIAAVTEVSACLSVPTLDEKAWRATEPHTPNPRARLEAVAELNRQGIPTGILIAPLMPGINDAPEQVARIVELATEAGATSIGGNTLFLRGSVRDIFSAWLREHRPDLVERYEKLYAGGAYLRPAERRRIERAAGAPWAGLAYEQRFRHRRGATGPGKASGGAGSRPRTATSQQVRLF